MLRQSVALAHVPFARDCAREAPGRARVALRDNTVELIRQLLLINAWGSINLLYRYGTDRSSFEIFSLIMMNENGRKNTINQLI